jgi:G3E family GTPase
MAEIISLAERLAARARSTHPAERPVVVVQSVRVREGHSLARLLATLSGGTVVSIPSKEASDCWSCSVRQALEDRLLPMAQEATHPLRPIWLVTPVDADPWATVDAFGPDQPLYQAGFRVRSFVSAMGADRLLHDWVSTRRIGHDRQVPLVEAMADQIDFTDAVVLSGTGLETPAAAEFLRSLNTRAEILGRSEVTSEWARQLTSRDFLSERTANGAVWRLGLQFSKHAQPGQVFRRARPFHPERFYQLVRRWPEQLLRSEGIAWIASETDVAFTITQAGPRLFDCSGDGYWLATLPADELQQARQEHPEAFQHWNPETGDRMTELAFAWDCHESRLLHSESFFSELDRCLLSDFEMHLDWTRFRDPFREEREKEWARSEKRRTRKPHFKSLHSVGHHTGEPTNGNTQEKDL